MKPLMLSAAALLVAFGLSACESRTSSTTVVQPKEVVKEKSDRRRTDPRSSRPSGTSGRAGKTGR